MKISGVDDQLEGLVAQGLPPNPALRQHPGEESFGTILKQVERTLGAPDNQQGGSGSLPQVDEERLTLAPLWQVQAPGPIQSAPAIQQRGAVNSPTAPRPASSQGDITSPRTLIDLFRGLVAAFRQARAQGKNLLAAVFDTVKYLLSLIKLSGPPAASPPPSQRINERV
jgi:hypothetical protein